MSQKKQNKQTLFRQLLFHDTIPEQTLIHLPINCPIELSLHKSQRWFSSYSLLAILSELFKIFARQIQGLVEPRLMKHFQNMSQTKQNKHTLFQHLLFHDTIPEQTLIHLLINWPIELSLHKSQRFSSYSLLAVLSANKEETFLIIVFLVFPKLKCDSWSVLTEYCDIGVLGK